MNTAVVQRPIEMRPTALTSRVQVRHVAKSYVMRGLYPLVRKNQVLVDASLEVPTGQIVAIVGANGSGKSTLMKIIAGVLEPDDGTISVTGSIGYCPQSPVLYDKLTVAETFYLFGMAYNLAERTIRLRGDELMATLDFGRYADYRVEQLSGGTQQKLNLAIALMHDPDVLLLDEPYTGFDYETYLRFWDLSEEILSRDRSIVVISHFVERQERFDRIYRIREGRSERER